MNVTTPTIGAKFALWKRFRSGPAEPSSSRPTDRDRLGYGPFIDNIVARLGAVVGPCILFVSCRRAIRTESAGHDLAMAASWRLGSTLYLSFGANQSKQVELDDLQVTRDPALPAFFRGTLPPEILSRQGTEQPISTLLEATSRAYRLVVIDCAAPSVSAQALALAPLCTATIVVVEAGTTPLADITSTIGDLSAAGACLLGTVLVHPGRAWRGGFV